MPVEYANGNLIWNGPITYSGGGGSGGWSTTGTTSSTFTFAWNPDPVKVKTWVPGDDDGPSEFPSTMQVTNGHALGVYCIKHNLTKLPKGYTALNEDGRAEFRKVIMSFFDKGLAHPAKAGPAFAAARQALALIGG